MCVLVVMSQLGCGGSETVVYHLLQYAKNFGVNMQLVVMGEIDTSHFNDLNLSQVEHKMFDSKLGKLQVNLKKIKFIRQIIKKNKIKLVLSFIDVTNVLVILASLGLNIPVIISERNNPKYSSMARIWYLLRRLVYPAADALVVANHGLKEVCGHYHKNIYVIPNLMRLSDLKAVDCPKKRIIAVGSLTWQKRFDVLIAAAKILFDRNELGDFYFDIYGSGPLLDSLNNQIKDYGLQTKVFLKGRSDNIFNEYIDASIFVLTSDYEGQPNVLLEAMSVGLPCIATDCNFGPGELINNGENGLLVPIQEANLFAESLSSLIHSNEKRKYLGDNARVYIRNNFSVTDVATSWFGLFEKMINKYESRCTTLR